MKTPSFDKVDLANPSHRQYVKRLISQSGCFDPDYYLSSDPLLREEGVDALEHFLNHGYKEMRPTAADFYPKNYADANPDLPREGFFHLLHYLLIGKEEGRLWSPEESFRLEKNLLLSTDLFDPDWYVRNSPDLVNAPPKDPYMHYLRFGFREARSCSPKFQNDHYLQVNPDLIGIPIKPLIHYLTRGRREGRPLNFADLRQGTPVQLSFVGTLESFEGSSGEIAADDCLAACAEARQVGLEALVFPLQMSASDVRLLKALASGPVVPACKIAIKLDPSTQGSLSSWSKWAYAIALTQLVRSGRYLRRSNRPVLFWNGVDTPELAFLKRILRLAPGSDPIWILDASPATKEDEGARLNSYFAERLPEPDGDSQSLPPEAALGAESGEAVTSYTAMVSKALKSEAPPDAIKVPAAAGPWAPSSPMAAHYGRCVHVSGALFSIWIDRCANLASAEGSPGLVLIRHWQSMAKNSESEDFRSLLASLIDRYREWHRFEYSMQSLDVSEPRIRNYLLSKFKAEPEEGIFVYQMGKTASMTVYESLRVAFPSSPIIHCHALHKLDEIEDTYFKLGLPDEETFAHLRFTREISDWMRLRAPGRRMRVITLVREPIARNMSSFFHVIGRMMPNLFQEVRDGKISVAQLQDLFLHFGALDCVDAWFEEQLEPVFGVDVWAEPFDFARGYKIYQSDVADVLLIRTEDLNRVFEAATREFLGEPIALLPVVNTAEDRGQSDVVKFLRAQALPTRIVEEMLDCKTARHFYSDTERAAFRKKWLCDR